LNGFLFVCTGNICRSPIAASVMRAALIDVGLSERYRVDSAGIHALVGRRADAQAVKVALAYNADIRGHVARLFTHDDFLRYEQIIAMDTSHVDYLRAVMPANYGGTLTLLPSGDGRELQEIADPYGASRREFERAGRLIAQGIGVLVARLIANAGAQRSTRTVGDAPLR
jgi:protein-tyrosine phosphatase